MVRSGFVCVAFVALLIGAAVWYVLGVGGSHEAEQGRVLKFHQVTSKETPKSDKGEGRSRLVKKAGEPIRVAEAKVEKPNLTLLDDEDAKLTDEMRQLYKELQQALDDEDKQRVFALVNRLQSMKEWPDGIPQAVKMHALDALAWFGSSGMAEAVGFLADGDNEVVNATIEKFEEMLSDFDLGDVGVSEILSLIVKVVHDTDALDTFYMEMNNMRDTVKAQTVLNIFDSGNKDAIAVLNENIEFIFSDADYEIRTRADVEQYLAAAEQVYVDNPEKVQEDEDFYGPSKD